MDATYLFYFHVYYPKVNIVDGVIIRKVVLLKMLLYSHHKACHCFLKKKE
jgi:hypothetical protein